MADDREICREILAVAEQMYGAITDSERLDDSLMRELREKGEEMDRLADKLG